MPTTKLQTLIANQMLVQCGNGVPDHDAPIYSTYVDLDTGIEYMNTDGVSRWMRGIWEMPNINLGDGVTSGVSVFRAGAGGIQYAFDGTSDDEWSSNTCLANNKILYDGSDLQLKISYQLSENPGAGDTVEFEVQYAFLTAGDNSDGAGTTFTDAIDQTGRVVDQIYTDILPTNLIGVADKELLQLSIMRDALGGGSDSFPGSIWVVDIDIEKV